MIIGHVEEARMPPAEPGWSQDPATPQHLVLDATITHGSGGTLVTAGGRQVLALPPLSGSSSGLLRAVDLSTGAPLPDRSLLRYDRHEVLALGAGRLLATMGPQADTVVVRDAVTGTPVGPPIRLGSRPREVALAVADSRPVLATTAPHLSVWDVATGAPIVAHERVNGRHFATFQGRLLLFAEQTKDSLQAYDVLTGAKVGPPVPCDFCMSVHRLSAVEHDGRLLVAFLDSHADTGITLWDATAGAELATAPPFGDVRLIDLAMVNGGPLLAAARSGKSGPPLLLWDPVAGRQVLPDFFAGYDGDCTRLALGALDDGFFALTVGSGGSRLWVWSADGTRRAVLTGGWAWRAALGTVDGRPTIALAGSDADLRLFDARTAAEFGSPCYGGRVQQRIVGTLDGATVVLDGRPMRLWDVDTGPVARLDRLGGGSTGAATGRLDGRPVIALVHGERDVPARLSVWHPGADVPVCEVSLEPFRLDGARPGEVVFTEVGGRAAVAVAIGGAVHTFDAATGDPCGHPYRGPGTVIAAIAAGRAGERPVVAVSGSDAVIHLVDPASGQDVVPPMAGHSERVTALALGVLDGRTVLVSAARDNTVRVWDATTGEPVGAPWTSGHSETVNDLRVTEWNGEPVVLCLPSGGPPRLWRLRAGAPATGHTAAVRTVAAGRWAGRAVFASGGDDRTVRMWDAATGQPLGPVFTDHAAPVTHVAFSGPHRDILVTADETGVVVRRQHHDSEPLVHLGARIAGLGTAEVDGRAVVGIASGNGLRIWDATTGEAHADLRAGEDAAILHADLGVLDGRLVALTIAFYDGDDEPTLTVWDVATGTALHEPVIVPEESAKLGVLTEMDRRLVAVRGKPQDDDRPEDPADVHVVDVATGRVLGRHRHKHGWNQHAAVARVAGRPVVLIAAGDAVVVVDPAQVEYGGHRATVTCVAAAEVDGRTVVASGDLGNALHFWHPDTGERIR